MPNELDLTPDPRVLQMLGEINLHQWRCIAELIDNSIDGFMAAIRDGNTITSPEVSITLPTRDDENARVAIKDNGPGMSVETLENAVRAGWTGNNPLSSLGLFGMGFNISTARLGMMTEVWTTRAGDPEYVGVRIDLEDLRRSRSFRVPRQTRPKAQHAEHGTEIVISRLKPDQRAYLARTNNIKTIRKHLARTYSPLLTGATATNLRVKLNGTRVEARRHCIWDDSRSVSLPDGSAVNAVETVNIQLAPRRYCLHCMLTLTPDQTSCPNATADCNIEETQRSVRGWIGLQRYLDETEFGIDFVRNGRKIEIGNKDLFVWINGDSTQVEYPTDDPRGRGRFVGELHINHCRVSYTKDRFERDDPAWDEMVRIIRGDGPLRPITARQQGYGPNTSPLFRLFQAFRRSSPQGKNALWSRFLVVRDNERAQQMADLFYENDPDYLTDDKWWELVEEQDREVLGEGQGAAADNDGADGKGVPEGFADNAEAGTPTTVEPETVTPPLRRPLFELTRRYVHPVYRVEYEVQAFSVALIDPELPAGCPWVLLLDDPATRTYAFLVNEADEVFRSKTMTPLDGLLTELAFRTLEFLRSQIKDLAIAGVLADLRGAYSLESRLDSTEIIASAVKMLSEIASAFSLRVPADSSELFQSLSDLEKASVTRRIASRGFTNPKAIIASGRFLEFADGLTIRSFVKRHPNLFFDGAYWDDPFETLDYGDEGVTRDAKDGTAFRYDSYLGDAVWLSMQSPDDLDKTDRDLLIRATCSLRLLRPDQPADE